MQDRFTIDGNLFAVPEPHVAHNEFAALRRQNAEFLKNGQASDACGRADTYKLPTYEDAARLLPEPVWEGREDVVRAYRKAWQIAFKNLRKAKAEAGFVSDFIDTAFNGFLFMWDSSFIVMFGKYGAAAFNFQQTLDNFYAHQHRDGFISREISETDGREQFSRDDPASTGPNILPWAEWEYYQTTGDASRIARVFDPLLAYHHWLQLNRSWQDGTYWSCGLACGMDNQPRAVDGFDPAMSHGFMSWIDTCAQQYLSGRILTEMGRLLGREDETKWLAEEAEFLKRVINDTMWSAADNFYYDKRRDGSLSGVKTVGAYWTLLAGLVPEERRKAFIEHLDDPKEFNRPVRVPTLSADDPHYQPDGGYWLGSVWAPTNYMILKALGNMSTPRAEQLAREIARNYVDNVVNVFERTGTLYENYAPEHPDPGRPAKDEFVGWTGLAPISVLFEYVFGIRPEALRNRIVWHVNLNEAHGIRRYPFKGGTVTLLAGKRNSAAEMPEFTLESTVPVDVELHVAGQTIERHLEGTGINNEAR